MNAGTLATAIAIRDDGDKTRELINPIDRQNLSRQLAVAGNTIVELRQGRGHDHRAHGIEIRMTNNQNQLQFQAQAQGMAYLQHGLMESDRPCDQPERSGGKHRRDGDRSADCKPDERKSLRVSDLNRLSGAVFQSIDDEEQQGIRIRISLRIIPLQGLTFTIQPFASGLCKMRGSMQACCRRWLRNRKPQYVPPPQPAAPDFGLTLAEQQFLYQNANLIPAFYQTADGKALNKMLVEGLQKMLGVSSGANTTAAVATLTGNATG